MRPTLFGMLAILALALGACGHEFDYEGEGAEGKADTVWSGEGEFALVDACSGEDASPIPIPIELDEPCEQPDPDDDEAVEDYYGDGRLGNEEEVGCGQLRGKCFPRIHRGRVQGVHKSGLMEQKPRAPYWQMRGPHYLFHNDTNQRYKLSAKLLHNHEGDPLRRGFESDLLGLEVIQSDADSAEKGMVRYDASLLRNLDDPLYWDGVVRPGERVRIIPVGYLNSGPGLYSPYLIEFTVE